jgi:very-short-patch-repair endonuclease
MTGMDVRQHLHRLGGVADRSSLVGLTSRAEVERALRTGDIVRDARGRYALPVAEAALRVAGALSAVVSHRSAALHWGWELKTVPTKPEVTVRRKRRLTAKQRSQASVHWADLEAREMSGSVTSPRRTLVDCLRGLPFDEALAVADSALRHGSLDTAKLVEVAGSVRGAGAAACRRVAQHASEGVANPFESVLRALAIDVPGLDVEPQVMIRAPSFSVQPDLVDERRRIVLEADSFAWHGDRSALRWDARRYNNLVTRGWLVLRFAWEDVMHDQDYVRHILAAVSDLVHRQAEALGEGSVPA